jgi:hypothetical protein
LVGWETLSDAIATDTNQFGGAYLNRITQLLIGADIAAADSTLAPIIGTKFTFKSGKLWLQDVAGTHTINIIPDTQTVDTVLKTPLQSFTPDYISLRKQSESLENKTLDGSKNTFLLIPDSALSANVDLLNTAGTTTALDTFLTNCLGLRNPANTFTTTLNSGAIAGAITITLPTITNTLVGRTTTDTLTGKIMDYTQNTFLNFPGGSLPTGVNTGDLAKYSGSAWVLLPRGAASYLLSMNGSGNDVVWAAPPSGTFSNSSVDIYTNKTLDAAKNTLLFSSTYYYTIYQDPNDSNKFKARNNKTGLIDYVSAGSTDATSVLQGAFTAASGLGAIIVTGATYPVTFATSPILTVPNNTHIIGTKNTNIVSQTTSKCVIANASRTYPGTGNHDIVIENITINGNWDLTSAHVDDACGILLDNVTDVQVKGCKIINTWGEGIKCRNSLRALIQGNYVNSTADGKAGMIIASNSNYGQIIGNICVDAGGESYSVVADSAGLSTNHVVISDNIGYVTYVNPTLQTIGMPRGHILVESLGGTGVNDVVISNNNIMAGFANGIIVSNSLGRDLVISGNTITHFQGVTSFPAVPSSAHGIAVSSNSVDIIGNIVHDVYGHGIVTSAGNSKINISNNIIRNVGLNQVGSTGYAGPYDGIRNDSSGTAILDNIVSNNIILDENTNMRYGIYMIGTSGRTSQLISNNSIRGNQSTPAIVQDPYPLSTTGMVNCRTKDNLGFNPIGVISTPFPTAAGPESGGTTYNILNIAGAAATPTSARVYTNKLTTKKITITGGTVTSIFVNGIESGQISGSFILEPSETISVTYSIAPTVTVRGY